MSTWIDFRVDVLAGSPAEINAIEAELQEPCADLLTWVASRRNETPDAIAADLKTLVCFQPTENLGRTSRARGFTNLFKSYSWGIVMSHISFVSEHFPSAVFLLHYWDLQASCEGKKVIYAGHTVQQVHDGNQLDQAQEWVLPNIFAPYWTEYGLGLAFGSLWTQWLDRMASAVDELKLHAATEAPHRAAEQQEATDQ